MNYLNKSFARNPHENHRVATTLELFFDLVFVVAIASAGTGLHHSLQLQHISEGIAWYLIAFFAIFWSWLNYAWYASAYDNDDTFFRLTTFLQIFGALVLAVGISKYFEPEHDRAVSIAGYVIMRIAMVIHWFRAAALDKERRNTCLRYGISIAIVQILWVVSFIVVPEEFQVHTLVLIGILEISVPLFAEKNFSVKGTPWHPHHMAERYSLLTIIVLGEGILGTTNTISSLINIETRWEEAFPFGLAAAGLIFSLWWSYFKIPWGEILEQNKSSRRVPFLFGYGHYFVFASLAAVGVGLQIMADRAESLTTNEFDFTTVYALMCVAVPVSSYLLMMSFYRSYMIRRSKYNMLSWLAALVLPFIPVVFNYYGLKLEWALFFSVLAPMSFIILNNYDDHTDKNTRNFEAD